MLQIFHKGEERPRSCKECVVATWTPKVCRIIALYRFWDIILLTFGGLGSESKTLNLHPGTSQLGLGFTMIRWPYLLESGFRIRSTITYRTYYNFKYYKWKRANYIYT